MFINKLSVLFYYYAFSLVIFRVTEATHTTQNENEYFWFFELILAPNYFTDLSFNFFHIH